MKTALTIEGSDSSGGAGIQADLKTMTMNGVYATSGARLINENAVECLKEKLLPLAALVTPNIPEAEVLAAMTIKNDVDMVNAAKKISETYHCAVLCKGGHCINDANDLLYINGTAQ